MPFLKIIVLALVQGAAELLPVSSSAHVIVAEKLMGLDPGAPEMTFLLVMLHTGTMFAVLFYFWPRWKKILLPGVNAARKTTFDLGFIRLAVLATAVTGVIGLGLKALIEKLVLPKFGSLILGTASASGPMEIERLFGSLPLIGGALFAVGIVIVLAGIADSAASEAQAGPGAPLTSRNSILIGLIQGLCLPFRGFSRSGATISTGLFSGISRGLAEEFSFALAVLLTPPVVALELHRLMKHAEAHAPFSVSMLAPGLLGMAFSFIAGVLALKWLSSWLEEGKWKYFGYYCLGAAGVVFFIFSKGY